MDNETLWKAYVGERTRREFLEHWHDCTLQDYVRAYVAQLPHLYGIALRNTWRETFASQPQLNRGDVIYGLLRYLEEQPDEWADLPAPRPQPAPAPEPAAAPVDAAPPDTPDTPDIPDTGAAPLEEAVVSSPPGEAEAAVPQEQPAEPAPPEAGEAPVPPEETPPS